MGTIEFEILHILIPVLCVLGIELLTGHRFHSAIQFDLDRVRRGRGNAVAGDLAVFPRDVHDIAAAGRSRNS